ncbi:conserved oligomeric Golgi complex subunit 8 [Brachionus plicatilis]|uniref:Conserved oligomeric Golgi complex subunit 8 n=1 Tax=Brachionus plicatilis TaxID=10195 RepID=A0A3M7QBQ3_BRAPC|nr:conserved oligomeric Golgi complex subunit 8 [Brachionus plicatilis]
MEPSEPSNVTSGEQILYNLLLCDESEQGQRASINESLAYLQELNSFHLDRLQCEPRSLFEQKQAINEEIKNLAFSNYKTFIRTAQCSKDIYSDFSIIDAKLDQLMQKMPPFHQESENFTKNIHSMNWTRRATNQTLQKHNQLLEILEISQVMETCVRNEYYEEALDLANYVKRLDKKYSSTIPLVQQITDDANRYLNLMLHQLLQQLKTNIQFNQCLKIISLIRRLDVFAESELRIKFLQLRDVWLNNLLQRIPTNDPYTHVTKSIEELRIHLFDIITQYKALFSDDDTVYSSATGANQDKLLASLLLNNKQMNESKLFYCWLQSKISQFLAILDKDLRLGVGSRIDSLLSQAMYFGLAFSRVGLDFRALMVPLFERVILSKVSQQVTLAQDKFNESLGKLNWVELCAEKSRLQDFFDSNSTSTIINPPIKLLDFQPLAVYLNVLLQCFNEIRLCLPLSVHSKVLSVIKSSFRDMAKFVCDYEKKSKFDKSEKELFVQFVSYLAHVLVPFVQKCFLSLFPLDQIQKVYGVSQSEMEDFKQMVKLDPNELLVEIGHLIPEESSGEQQVQVDGLNGERVDQEKHEEENVEDAGQESVTEESKSILEEI